MQKTSRHPQFSIPAKPWTVFDTVKLLQGDRVIAIPQDHMLWSALVTVGIPMRKDRQATLRMVGEKKEVTYLLSSTSACGWLNTLVLIKGWKNPVQWLSEHPVRLVDAKPYWTRSLPAKVIDTAKTHPWSPFVEFKLNHDTALHAVEAGRAWVTFQPDPASSARCHVVLGSAKYRDAIAEGWKQL